eukprot:COSAG04_NODE_6342_length_1352_cov_1.758180_1_plen_59_part_10
MRDPFTPAGKSCGSHPPTASLAAAVLGGHAASQPNEDYDARVAAKDEQKRRAAAMYEAL